MNGINLEPIAIIGFSFRYPQDATSVQAFWEMIASRRCATTNIPEDRWNAGSFTHANPTRRSGFAVKGGHFIKEDLGAFDARFFSISPEEAMAMDPHQRIILEETYRAFENAGIPMSKIRGTDVSVHTSSFADDYRLKCFRDLNNLPKYCATGTEIGMLANRVSWFYDFHGPTVNVDSACAGGLVAVDLACAALRSGDASMSVVAAGALVLDPENIISLANMGFLSPDSRCFSYDARANGYAKGEGVGVVILQKLSEAVKSGNSIRAVIRATSANSNGNNAGITQPCQIAQRNLIMRAYEKAGLSLAETKYVEGHGTGTAIGDVAEANSLGSAFFDRPGSEALYIGCVKSNIGHLEGGAGIAGIIKTIMVLESGVIPPNTNFEQCGPQINEEKLKIKFPRKCTPWPSDGLRRASVNSFGFGGSGAHAVLEDAYNFCRMQGIKARHHTRIRPPNVSELCDDAYASDFFRITNTQDEEFISRTSALEEVDKWAVASTIDGSPQSDKVELIKDIGKTDVSKNHRYSIQVEMSQSVSSIGSLTTPTSEQSGEYDYAVVPRIFVLSANDENGIRRISQAYQKHFNKLPIHSIAREDYIDDLSYTLNVRRTPFNWRSFAVLSPNQNLSNFGEMLKAPTRSKVSPNLSFVFSGQGAQWPRMGRELLAYEVFSSSLRVAQETLSGFGCSWLLLDELLKESSLSRVHDAELSQPISTAIQIALIDLLRSLSIVPSLVIGHSSGEIAAAYAIGALSNESALRIAFHRGRLAAKLSASSERSGRMMVVRLSESELSPFLSRLIETSGKCQVEIACYNSPKSLTLSGDEEELKLLKSLLESDDIFARFLRVNVAYHSFQMHRIAEEYLSSVQNITAGSFQPHTATMISTVTARPITRAALLEPKYWVANILSPVRFAEAVGRICQVPKLDSGDEGILFPDYFLEIGPHSVLEGPIRESSETGTGYQNRGYGSVLRRGTPGVESFLNSLGDLFCAGYSVDLSRLYHPSDSRKPQLLIDLPQYPFDHSETYWINGRLDQSYRMRQYPHNELLGTATVDWNSHDAVWSSFFRPSEMPWLEDHKINGSVLYPAPGMLVMAIEALLQVVPNDEDVSACEMKNVDFQKTLLIPENGKETRFSLRRLRDSANKWSSWYEFILYVYEDSSFHENCRGKIRPIHDPAQQGESYLKGLEDAEVHTKILAGTPTARIQSKRFYEHLAKCGLNYGPTFQRLQSIRYDRQSGTHATSEVRLFECNETSVDRIATHVIHPTSLDAIAHSMFIPLTNGAITMMPTNIPTRLDRLWVSKNGFRFPESIAADVHSNCKKTGPRTASADVAVFDKDTHKPLLVMSGLQTSIVADTIITPTENLERFCYSVESKPDVSLFEHRDMEKYFSPKCHLEGSTQFSDKLTRFLREATLSTKADLVDLDRGTLPNHLMKYLGWMDRVPLNCTKAKGLNTEHRLVNRERSSLLNCLAEEVSSFSATGRIFAQVGLHLPSIILGQTNIHELLFSGSLARDYYHEVYESTNFKSCLAGYLDLLAHKNPNMKILEIGAGTGGATAAVLSTLHVPSKKGDSHEGVDRFAQYTFTDVSPFFFDSVKERLGAQAGNLEFAMYDIENSPESQGLELGGYDLVVAFSVLHLADDLEFAVRGARKLLKTGGTLIMSEIVRPEILRGSFIWGLFPDWWKGTQTYREWGPCISQSRWNEVLTANGFSGIDHSVSDFNNESCHEMSMIISTAVEAEPLVKTFPTINVIVDDSSKFQIEIATSLRSSLIGPDSEISSYSVTAFDKFATQPIIPGCCYIFLADLNGSELFGMSPDTFEILHDLFLSATQVLWVNKTPSNGIIDGLSRVLRSERSELTMATITLECEDASIAADHIAKLISRSTGLIHVDLLEDEYEEKNGFLEIKRLEEEPTIESIMNSLHAPLEMQEQSIGSNMSMTLIGGPTGLLSSLAFMEDNLNSSLGAGDIEIQVHAIGLNNSDYLAATGKLNRTWLGGDCSGVVTCSNDDKFEPGDFVVVCGTSTARTIFHANSSRSLIAKAPTGFDIVSAASIPTVFTLAYYALVQVGGLSAGDSVLIHCASSGVGQAAIQIAQHYGATIYTTVGSHEKKEFLLRCFKLSGKHILNSRDPSFSSAINILTKGEGVNFVLCPFSDDRSDASVECLSSSGHYLDIALDVANRKVELPRANMSYSRINLASIIESRLKAIRPSFDIVMSLLTEKKLKVTSPIHTFPASKVVEAFNSCQDDTRIGSNVLELKKGDSVQVLLDKEPRATFDPNSTYLISGGLGGLGRDIASWMVRCGARHLVLLSRSGPQNHTERFVKSLRDQGVELLIPICDISREEDVKAALEKCAAMPPIRGCVQAAVVMEDLTFARLGYESWSKVANPKIQGSWNLHKLLPIDMDFFIMMSSMIGIIGNVSQASYAAGNTYQDALAHLRRSKGQNATSLDLGPVSDIGQLAEEEDMRAKVESTGHFTMLSSTDIHAMLAYYIQGGKGPQLVTGIKPRSRILDANNELPYWIQRPLFKKLDSSARAGTAIPLKVAATADLSSMIAQASDSDVEALVTSALIEKLSRTLSIPLGKLDPLDKMSAFGVDSLFSVDLRNWFMKELHADIAIFDIMGNIEVRELVKLAIKRSKLRTL